MGFLIDKSKIIEVIISTINLSNSHYQVTISQIYNEQKNIIGATSIIQDITLLKELENESILHEKKLQDEILKRKKIQKDLEDNKESMVRSANLVSLGEMAAGIAHEINNPLSFILMSNQIIEKYIVEHDKENNRLSNNLKMQEDSINRINHIIQSMKNLSRNTDNMGVEICKLETIMDQALILSKSKFVKKDISFTQVGYQNLKDTNLLCKEIEIGQIIINLLNNSVDAVSELSDRWIKIEYKKDESFMTLSFIDSGTGIDPKIKNRILEPFYSSKDIGKGTGLGLSISQKLIMNQRGSLELDVESEHTKFDLAIPLAK